MLGNDLKTVKYQKKICKIKGKFLNNSTYINDNLLIIQFEESLETPIINPSIVAKNIPKKGSGLSRQELIDKVNNKTANDLEKQELEMIEEMDILP